MYTITCIHVQYFFSVKLIYIFSLFNFFFLYKTLFKHTICISIFSLDNFICFNLTIHSVPSFFVPEGIYIFSTEEGAMKNWFTFDGVETSSRLRITGLERSLSVW